MTALDDRPRTQTADHAPSHACYCKGCPSPACLRAHRIYLTRWRMDVAANGHKLVDATGVRRRLLALGCIGWPRGVLADLLGVGAPHVTRMHTMPRIHRDTAAKVTALYARLENTPGPGRPHVAAKARRLGGHVPADWDGLNIDDPDSWPEQFDTRTNSCRRGRHARCTGERLLETELGAEPAPCSCQCHDKCA